MRIVHETLLANLPLRVENTQVRIPSLRDVFEMGLEQYLERLQAIVIDLADIDLMFEDKELILSDFQIFMFLISEDSKLRNLFFEGLELFTGQTFVSSDDYIVSVRNIYDDDGKLVSTELVQPLTEKYWIDLRTKLRLAHWMSPIEKLEFQNDKARRMMEKIKKNKEKVRKIKERKGDGTSELYELVSAVAIYSKSYNLLNIWDLTYYQFFDQFYRLNISDTYQFSIKSLLAGADPKKLKIEHWSSPIKQDN